MPAWPSLPTQTQAALIELMIRLILDLADKSWLSLKTEAGHEVKVRPHHLQRKGNWAEAMS
jgi:hypothetical protein